MIQVTDQDFSTKNPEPISFWEVPRIMGSGLGGTETQQVQQKDPPAPHTPKEDADSLFSTSYARGLDLISEGPIYGLCYPNGRIIRNTAHMRMAIYFDDTPVQNSDGTLNIRGVGLNMRNGTQDQTPIPGFSRPADMIPGGERLKKNYPVFKTITNSDANWVEVAVRIPSLVQQDKENGDVHGATVQYAVYAILNEEEDTDGRLLGIVQVTGKATQPYIISKLYGLPRSAPDANDTWQIKVARITPDAANLNLSNDTYLEFMNVYTSGSFAYPNSAIVAIEVDSRGYQNLPVRGYHVKLLKVKVPSNYFPETRLYTRDSETGEDTGVEQPWDGSFYFFWSDNPAWCWYDIVTNNRYGLGDYIPEDSVDKWTLYEIGRYCDEMVDDGFGGEEPRFSCNVYIQGQEEAFKVLNDFASVFRGLNYYAQGTVFPVQDRPREPWLTFTNANIQEGMFTYAGTAKKARHTVAIVRWIDPEENYHPKYEYVEEWSGIQKYGYRETQITSFACTSQGQAHRLGRWTLLSELNETDTVIFRAGMVGGVLRPGDLFQVLDNNRSGTSQGGRILAISEDGKTVRLDRKVRLEVVGTNYITLLSPQPFVTSPSQIEDSTEIASSRYPQKKKYTIATVATEDFREFDEITLTEVVDADTPSDSIFVVETPAVVAQIFRCINIQESQLGLFEVSGLEYNPGKFDASEHDLDITEPDITDLEPDYGRPPAPVDVKVEKFETTFGGILALKLRVSWTPPHDYSVRKYLVYYHRNADPFVLLADTSENYAELQYSLTGVYEFKVNAVGQFGAMSDAVVTSIEIKNESPIAQYSITGLELIGANSMGQGNDTSFIGRDAKFQWRINSPTNAPEELGTELETGAGSGNTDPFFLDYEVTVWDISVNPNIMVYREVTTDPHFEYTHQKNIESVGAPLIGRNQFQVQVAGRDKFGKSTPAAKLTVTNPAPQPPTNLTANSTINSVWLDWENPLDIDFDYCRIYNNTSDTLIGAQLIGQSRDGHFFHANIADHSRQYYWVVAIDTFGNESAYTASVNEFPGLVAQADIDRFAIDASRIFVNIPILVGDVWADNSPIAGYISWNDHTIYYAGKEFRIAAGNSNSKYIYWTKPADIVPAPDYYSSAYSNTNTHPALTDTQFIIATNITGTHDLAWNALANQVIGSAFIADASINDAKITSMSVSKLLAGTITAAIIVLDGAAALLKSSDFVAGTSGWQISGDGTAEFNNVVVRGTLDAAKIYNNSLLVNSSYPNNHLQSALMLVANYGPSFNYQYTAGANAYFSVLSGPVTRLMTIPGANYGSRLRFYGVGIADEPLNDTTDVPCNKSTRLGTSGPLKFIFHAFGTITGGQNCSVAYRIVPYSQYFPNVGSDLSPQGTSTYPWVISPMGALPPLTYADVSGDLPLIGYYELSVPATSVIEFVLVPLDDSAVGAAANDVITRPKFSILVVNP